MMADFLSETFFAHKAMIDCYVAQNITTLNLQDLHLVISQGLSRIFEMKLGLCLK